METGFWVALISTGGAITLYVLGNRVTRRFGLPTDIEGRLVNELKELNAALTENNKRLELEVAERKAAAEDCSQRLAQTEQRLDWADSRILRLLQRLGLEEEELGRR